MLRAVALLTLLAAIGCRGEGRRAVSDTHANRCPLVGTGSSCNTVVSAGQTVQVAVGTGSAPAPGGEWPPSGTYALVESRFFGGGVAETKTDNFTLSLSGSGASRQMNLVQLLPECPDSRETLAVTFEGNRLRSHLTCPPCPPGAVCDSEQTFAWDGKTLHVMQPTGGGTAVRSFVRVKD